MTKKLLSEDVIIDLKDYIENPSGYVLLAGENGTGKSHVGLHVYTFQTPYVLPAFDIDLAWFINQAELNMVYSDANEKYGSAMGILKQACNTKFLVIDDLGTRNPSAPFMDFLYAIIDRRWNERKAKGTLITTNRGSMELRNNFGDAIFSRIASGRTYIVTGPDRRFNRIEF